MGLLYSSFKMSGELLGDLNQEQRAAVTFGKGPLLVLAGVGTGKTTVITRRIAWLIAEKRATPAEILALTFTERAAAEMEERVDLLVPYGYIEAQIGTFHAFCDASSPSPSSSSSSRTTCSSCRSNAFAR